MPLRPRIWINSKNLCNAQKAWTTTMIVVETDREVSVPGDDSWWDVATAEVSESEKVQQARAVYEGARKKERYSVEFVQDGD
jgi:3D-(3,5/4)-trihydroxycyclohexane-1,2-dione acylhydrolase (decyclizing)